MNIRTLPINLLLATALAFLSLISIRADSPSSAAPIRVACVGDSITSGAGAPKGRAYPVQLQEILGSGWNVRNFGRGGRTLLRKGDHPYWSEPILQQALAFKPNVIVIMLGTNDSKPKNWVLHQGDFTSDYRDMVKLFQALDSKPRIYLCHVPTVVEPNKYKITETASLVIDQRVDALAKEMGLDVINMDQAYGGDLSVLGTDKVHPDEKGAHELAQTAATALLAASSLPAIVPAAN
jgi:lysophospholipase L1-like esterase